MYMLLLVLLTTLLSACVGSTLAEIRASTPIEVKDIPALAEPLSYCVYRGMEQADTTLGYTYRLTESPAKDEFFLTATRQTLMVFTPVEIVGMEVHFLAHDQFTTLEMRVGSPGGSYAADMAWPLIDKCAQGDDARPRSASARSGSPIAR